MHGECVKLFLLISCSEKIKSEKSDAILLDKKFIKELQILGIVKKDNKCFLLYKYKIHNFNDIILGKYKIKGFSSEIACPKIEKELGELKKEVGGEE